MTDLLIGARYHFLCETLTFFYPCCYRIGIYFTDYQKGGALSWD